jgi:tetratricopeptide (TPR) repeat protein
VTGVPGSDGTRAALLVEEHERPVYLCEDVEIDAALGCLKRGGEEHHLRQQSFHVLLYILERRHHNVTKEELIGNFWKDTAVTDNAVVQCIAEIRRALGDDPREPRFIRTLPKTGYRFVGNVTEVWPASEVAPPGQEVQGVSAAGRKRVRWIPVVALGALAMALAAWALDRRFPVQHLDATLLPVPGGKAVAVMYFDNQSGKQDLNWLREGLADMFITDLARFDRLTVLSRQQLHLLLAESGKKASGEVQLNDALEIARRSHADEVLMGGFLAVGEKLLVSVRLFDERSGQLVTAEHFVVDRPADILNQVDLLSPKLAARLVTVPDEVGMRSSLAETMTKSVEAYRYYSVGVTKAQAFQNPEAVSLLRKAIRLDPEFAMAYARIGYAYSVTDFLPDKGRPFLEKAIRLSDRLTPKDHLLVTAWYAISRRDYLGAIQTLQQIVAEYPLETEAYTRLARLEYREERPLEAIEVIHQGLRIDPDFGDLYNVLGMCFLGLGRYSEAIQAHEHYVRLSPNEPNPHDSLGMSFEQSGQYDRALTEYNTALSLDPEFEPAMIHLGDAYAHEGRYREAIAQYRQYVQLTRSDAARAIGLRSIAEVSSRLRGARAGEEIVSAEADRGSVDPERGSRSELRSDDYFMGLKDLRAKRGDQAIAHFRDALHHLPPSSGLDLYEDCLANAYLELGKLDEAIGEYQRILAANPNYPLADYHLALAMERKGRLVEAKTAYVRFLRSWKQADADIPEIVSTNRRIAAM